MDGLGFILRGVPERLRSDKFIAIEGLSKRNGSNLDASAEAGS
jgi:hypothetical protein